MQGTAPGFVHRARQILEQPVSAKVVGLIALAMFLPYMLRYYNDTMLRSTRPGQEGLEIKELIRQVKDELYKTELEMRERHEGALFAVKTFDLEINFMIQTKAQASAQLIALSGEAQTGREKIQKITLHLEALPQPHAERTTGPSHILRPPDRRIE